MQTLRIKFAHTKRQMARVLEVSYGGIVLLHMRYVERPLSDLSEFAGD